MVGTQRPRAAHQKPRRKRETAHEFEPSAWHCSHGAIPSYPCWPHPPMQAPASRPRHRSPLWLLLSPYVACTAPTSPAAVASSLQRRLPGAGGSLSHVLLRSWGRRLSLPRAPPLSAPCGRVPAASAQRRDWVRGGSGPMRAVASTRGFAEHLSRCAATGRPGLCKAITRPSDLSIAAAALERAGGGGVGCRSGLCWRHKDLVHHVQDGL
jgi:hypothetical protein